MLPVTCYRLNRPLQVLRDTGFSVLEFTRAQLAVRNAGVSGQRLDKVSKEGEVKEDGIS